MHLSMEYTNSINLLRAKAKWCLKTLRIRVKVNKQKKVVKGNILIQLKLLKDQWVIKEVTHRKLRDPLRPICFRFIKEVNLLKIKQCNKRVKHNKGRRYRILEIASKIWIQIVTKIRYHLKNLLSIRTKVFKGHLLKQRNQLLDLVLLSNQIKLNRIRL